MDWCSDRVKGTESWKINLLLYTCLVTQISLFVRVARGIIFKVYPGNFSGFYIPECHPYSGYLANETSKKRYPKIRHHTSQERKITSYLYLPRSKERTKPKNKLHSRFRRRSLLLVIKPRKLLSPKTNRKIVTYVNDGMRDNKSLTSP